MTIEKFFIKQMQLVFDTQKNKRRGHDSLVYENRIIPLTIRGMVQRLDRTLRINDNYAFLTSLPKWREIMATEYEGRKIDHEICDLVIPIANKILSPYTFNNRKGMGSQAAINQLMEHVYEVTEGYTQPGRIIKIDFKGYFPNAMWNYAEKCICKVIDMSEESEERKSYLKWLTMIAIHCNPAAHCEYRTPRYLWREHIPDEKSILKKPVGIGAAIGRLIWQTAMGLYINDVIKWITDDCGIRVVCFVDDIVMVAPERLHEYALSKIPIIRRMLTGRNVRLNEDKFYDQPCRHGVEFLGSHLRNNRLHLNNVTFGRAEAKIRGFNEKPGEDIEAVMSCFNSYTGLMKNRTDYKRIIKLKEMLHPQWWEYFDWDERRKCLVYKKGYSIKERLNKKYCLKLKNIGGRKNEERRASTAA